MYDDYVAPSKDCRKPGRRWAYVVVAPVGDDKGKIVDRGRTIDPLSMRREGAKVTWVKHGERRSAPFP